MLASLLRRIRPLQTSDDLVKSGESFNGFIWRASGVHQFYAGALAISVALLTFVPIDLQRRIVDEAIERRDVATLLFLCGIYALAVLLEGVLKYVLQVYQGWVGESAVKTSRDQLAIVANEQKNQDESGGQTVNVIGREIDAVGGFVGTSISEFVINLTLLVAISAYMLYIQPVIALVSAVFLAPQVMLALYMQRDLNVLVERQVGLVRKLGSETIEERDAPTRGAAGERSEGEFRTIRAIFRNRMRFNALKFGLKALLNAANAIGPLMVLLVGGYLVIQGQTTIGTVVAFVSGFERLSGPLRDLLNFYREYEQARVQHRMIVQWANGAPSGASEIAAYAEREGRSKLAAE